MSMCTHLGDVAAWLAAVISACGWAVGSAGQAAATAPNAPADPLAFTPAGGEFRFDTGLLHGTLGAGGKSLGLGPVVDVATGRPIAGAYGLLSPYRLLTADARFGTAAWDWPSRARLLADGAVEVTWEADRNHPLNLTAVYRLSARNIVDFRATVRPHQDLGRFELFLASYFQGFPTSLVYARQGPPAGKPAFLDAAKAGGDWQAFPRDDAAAEIIGDGRWARPPNPVKWTIRSALAAPLAIRRDANTGMVAVVMAGRADCFAVLTPYGQEGHRSLYLSLFGHDLRAGQAASAAARLVVGRGISDGQAAAFWRAYERQMAAEPSPQIQPGASDGRGARLPFFAFCMDTHDAKKRTPAQQAEMLAELGYDGAGHLWLDGLEDRLATLDAAGIDLFQVYFRLSIAPDAKPPYDPRLKDMLPLLAGRGTMLAVLISGGKPSDQAGDERAAALLREIADLARAHGVAVALYPHVRDWLERFDDALRVARKAARPNVGVMFNLCHYLRTDDEKDLPAALRKAGPLLLAVSLNGCDRGADLRAGNGRWIAPLDEGSFDTAGLLARLREAGYRGPVGLQCYGIGGDARDHLARSIAAWRRLQPVH